MLDYIFYPMMLTLCAEILSTAGSILSHLLLITMYVADLVADVVVAAEYYHDGHIWYCSLTLAFAALPAVVMSVVSAELYRRDRKEKVSTWQWIARGFCLLFFLSPVIRYAESLYYGILGRKAKLKQDEETAKQYFDRVEQEDDAATLLCLIESFLESAPQVVLRLYISYSLGQNEETYLWSVWRYGVPVMSLAWSIASYNRILWRTKIDEEHDISLIVSLGYFLIQMNFIVIRVVLLAKFALMYTWWIGPACLVHWAIMLIWIILQKTNTCSMKLEEILFDMLISVVHLFTHFDLATEKIRNLYIYHAIWFGENIVITVCTYTVFKWPFYVFMIFASPVYIFIELFL